MTTHDVPALRRLFLESRQATFRWQSAEEFAMDDFDRSTAGELVLVAAADEAIVGFVSCWLPQNFVHSLFVAPDRLRQGIGAALLDAALARLNRPAWLKCDRRNENAIEFYRARGWTVFQERVEKDADWIPFVLRSGRDSRRSFVQTSSAQRMSLNDHALAPGTLPGPAWTLGWLPAAPK